MDKSPAPRKHLKISGPSVPGTLAEVMGIATAAETGFDAITRDGDISFARFRKAPVRRAVKASATQPGLAYDYMEGRWFRLFGSADRLAAKSSGTVERLLDVGMRQIGDSFAVRYSGYLDVPAAGVYTFYAPKEYVVNEGLHRFQVVLADAWAKDIEHQRIDYWWGYPSPWVVWRGTAPVIELSGPGLARQPVPAAWLRRAPVVQSSTP